MIAFAIMISWFLPNVSATIENLGTIQYRDFKTIEKSGEYNLTLVYGEVNSSAIKVDLIYDNVFDSTYLRFVSNEITPDYWFDNNRPQQYIFQDENTLELFSVYINYSSLDMPENPVIMLDEITKQLENKTIEYNNTLNQLDAMTNNFTGLDLDYDNLTQNYTALIVKLNNTEHDIKTLNHNLNQSLDNSKNLSVNLTKYRNYYTGINSYNNDFWYENSKYPTLAKLNNDYNELAGQYGTTTLVLVILIIFAVLITWFFSRREKGFMKMNDTELDTELGYSKDSKKIDKTIIGFLKKTGKKLVPSRMRADNGNTPTSQSDKIEKIIEQHKTTPTPTNNSSESTETKVDKKILIEEAVKNTIAELDRKGLLS